MMDRLYTGIDDPVIKRYVARVTEEVTTYLKGMLGVKGAVVALGNQGRVPAMALRGHLYVQEKGGVDISFDDIVHLDDQPFKYNVKGRRLVVVGDPEEYNGLGKRVELVDTLKTGQEDLGFKDLIYVPVTNEDRSGSDISLNMGINTTEMKRFAEAVGPRFNDFIGDGNGAILSVKSGGIYYGMALAADSILRGLDEGVDISYDELSKGGGYARTRKTKGRRAVVVDDRVNTGTTWDRIQKKLKDLRSSGWLDDYKFAVEVDVIGGVADWVVRNPNEEEIKPRKGFFWWLRNL